MVMVKTGPQIRGQFIVDGTIDAADFADDSVGTAKIAAGRVMATHMAADAVGSLNVNANGIKGSHLASNALSQRIMATGPGLNMVRSVPTETGVYCCKLTGFQARFAWARPASSDMFASVFTILAGGSNVRITLFSTNDAAGSTRLVANSSNSIQVCWVT